MEFDEVVEDVNEDEVEEDKQSDDEYWFINKDQSLT
jgi:hypothetical protein